jgi:hypothetical protein
MSVNGHGRTRRIYCKRAGLCIAFSVPLKADSRSGNVRRYCRIDQGLNTRRMLSAIKVLIMGLPGSGKTTLAKTLAPLIEAVHFNADDVRANVNRDLCFSAEDRLKQARRMGWLCDRVTAAGHNVIADFVCPKREMRSVTAFSSGSIASSAAASKIQIAYSSHPPLLTFTSRSIGAPEFWAASALSQLSRRLRMLSEPGDRATRRLIESNNLYSASRSTALKPCSIESTLTNLPALTSGLQLVGMHRSAS